MASLWGNDTDKQVSAGLNKFLSDTGANIGNLFGGIGSAIAIQANPIGAALKAKPVTPKDSAIKKTVDLAAQQKQLYTAMDKSGLIKRPTGTTSGAGGTGGAKTTSKPLTDLLRVDTQQVYNPILDYIKKQEAATNARYQTNSAELKNIFGALTGIDAADKARITQQFKQAITDSQTNYAERVASEKEALAAGLAQAKATGAERGLGPEMAVNPITAATGESQARANEYQTAWEGLQRANEVQATADVGARTEGYNYQQAAAIRGLQQSLEDKLLGLGGQRADVMSQAAQAKLGVEQNIAQAKYSEAIAAKQAAIAASQKKSSTGLTAIREALGDAGFSSLASSADAAFSRAWDNANPVVNGQPLSKTVSKPTAAQVKAEWVAMGGDPKLIEKATKYIDTVYR